MTPDDFADRRDEAQATRQVVERAASILMKRHGLTEPEAFRWLSMAALHQRKSLRAVAEAVVLAESVYEDTAQ